ncbi:MAG: amidase domain-containing protein [Candidatus Nanopelagicales bacterium]|nr:amidase domain-containing protein [Candidatus Nanopelagicales bacterium]
MTFSPSRLLAFSGLIVLMVGLLFQPMSAQPAAAAVSDDTVRSLLRLTARAMERQARPYITGRIPRKSEPWVNDTTEALRLKPAHTRSLARFGRSLRRDGAWNSDVKVRLREVSRQQDGDKLVIEAKKHVRMPYTAKGWRKPVVEKQVLDVTLTYRRVDDRWLAVSAKTSLHPTAPVEPLEDPSFRFPVPKRAAATAADRRSPASSPDAVDTASIADGGVATQGMSKANRLKVRDYARKWAEGHNPAYGGEWAEDCTNFVSQAVRAGGWSYVGDGGWAQRDEPNMWGFYDAPWYEFKFTTYTWGGAQNFYQFGRFESRRLTWTSHVSYLVGGDILQARWRDDTAMSHSMVVTKYKNATKKHAKKVFLSYHTINILNKPFSKIQKANPGATGFPLHV